jgi:hypothetical protein
MVDEAGITPLPKHVAAVQDCPEPTDIKQLQRFLGLINFYRRFLPAVARILKPLTDLLKGSPKVLLWPPQAEVKYSTIDRELLAAFLTIRHFRFLLEGRQFTLMTDHKPLVASMTRVTPPQSVRQQRHLAFVSEFTTDLRHTPGSANVVADALSRPPAVVKVSTEGLPVLSIPPPSPPSDPPQTPPPAVAADAQPVDFTELAFAQPSCPDVQAMLASPSCL